MIWDILKTSLQNINRNSKNKILILIFVFLFFVLFIDIIIIKNFYEYYDYSINKNIGFRTLYVYNPTISREDAIKEIKKIKHVSEVYGSSYGSTAVSSNLNDNGLNGWIGLQYGTINTAPPSISGKNINELKSGELICPYEFYPDSNNSSPLDIDESKFLSEKDILNREIVISYSRTYTEVIDNKLTEKQQDYTQKMKIVGLYDETIFRNGINVCYATPEDIKNIQDSYNPFLEKTEYASLNVVVDEETNLKEVRQNIQNLGSYLVEKETIAHIDKTFTSILFSLTIIFAIIIITSILLILKNYLNKKIKDESSYLGILRACGYTKNNVIIQEIIENTLIMLLSFIISATLFTIIFTILENKIFKYFKYIGFTINNNIILIFITFIIVLIISELLNYSLVKKKINNSITDLLKEE